MAAVSLVCKRSMALSLPSVGGHREARAPKISQTALSRFESLMSMPTPPELLVAQFRKNCAHAMLELFLTHSATVPLALRV